MQQCLSYLPPPSPFHHHHHHQGPFDLYGAVAVGQAPPCLHDLAATLPVLLAAHTGAPLLRADLSPSEATQVTPLLFRSIQQRWQIIQRPRAPWSASVSRYDGTLSTPTGGEISTPVMRFLPLLCIVCIL